MALSEKETSPMIKFSANLSMLFNEVPFLDRFEAASKAGFRGVEYVGPYAFQAKDVAARLKDNGLSQVLFNLPVGDWDAGERGIAIFSERTDEFQDGVAKAIEYAKALGCSQVNCLAGIATTGQEADRLRALPRAGQKEPRHVPRVDGLDQQPNALSLQGLGRKTEIGDEGGST
jgi:hydroxypyruvate isomerase